MDAKLVQASDASTYRFDVVVSHRLHRYRFISIYRYTKFLFLKVGFTFLDSNFTVLTHNLVTAIVKSIKRLSSGI